MTPREPELSGIWAILFKLTIICVPVATAAGIPWMRWVTEASYRSEETRLIVDSMTEDMKGLHTRMSDMPPVEWRERVKNLEVDSRQNLTDHSDIKSQNLADHSSMKISLEQIKAAVGILPAKNE